MRMLRLRDLPDATSLLVWAVLWELTGRFADIDFIPPLTRIFATILETLTLPAFHGALAETAEAFLIGMALAVAVGVPLGVLMGLRRSANRLFSVWVDIFLSAPLTAMVPALMPLLGIGQATVVATVFLFAVWVIVLDTQAGVMHANRSLVEMGRSFGGRPRTILFEIILPNALPEIVTGLKLAVVRGVKGVVIGQIIIALVGFGALFELYLTNFLMERFWALVFIIFGIAFLLVGLVDLVEKRIEYYAARR